MSTRESFEWFLTQNGWIKGGEKTGLGEEQIVALPNDTILRVVFFELDNGYSATDCWCKIEVKDSRRFNDIDTLLTNFGMVPEGYDMCLASFKKELTTLRNNLRQDI